MPGFAAYVAGSAKKGPALCKLNIAANLGTVVTGVVEPQDLPYLIAESLMHEVIHVLEDWAGVEFSEERVEALIDQYRANAGMAVDGDYVPVLALPWAYWR